MELLMCVGLGIFAIVFICDKASRVYHSIPRVVIAQREAARKAAQTNKGGNK